MDRGPSPLFPADRGLQVRMVVATLLTPVLVLAAVVAIVLFAPLVITAVFALSVTLCVWRAVDIARSRPWVRPLSAGEEPQLQAIVERLCALSDLPKPFLVCDNERQPNSWVVAPLRWRAELHVTRGLLDLLTPAELEAVIAHELSHIAHRDAVVMTIVGTPSSTLLDGGVPVLRATIAVPGALLAIAIGAISRVGTTALSRYRELAADAGAAALTGHPATLAVALRKVSGGLAAIPSDDLRAVARRDAFHLLPVADADSSRRRLRLGGATHPKLARRIARLEAMEARLHGMPPARVDHAPAIDERRERPPRTPSPPRPPRIGRALAWAKSAMRPVHDEGAQIDEALWEQHRDLVPRGSEMDNGNPTGYSG
jgi:heat shock protein HtpX